MNTLGIRYDSSTNSIWYNPVRTRYRNTILFSSDKQDLIRRIQEFFKDNYVINIQLSYDEGLFLAFVDYI